VSIDIDIAPLLPSSITWGALRHSWADRLGNDAAILLGPTPLLRRLGTNELVPNHEMLAPSTKAFFELAVPNTLSLAVSLNEGNLDELDYVDDYGRNLSPSEIQRLADAWRQVGWTYGLTSLGGRSPKEPTLLRTLACAIADLCDGRIVLMHHNVFSLDIGVYTSSQFAQSSWTADS
jgi:hypothetical protein